MCGCTGDGIRREKKPKKNHPSDSPQPTRDVCTHRDVSLRGELLFTAKIIGKNTFRLKITTELCKNVYI